MATTALLLIAALLGVIALNTSSNRGKAGDFATLVLWVVAIVLALGTVAAFFTAGS